MSPESLCHGRGVPPSPGRGPAAQGSMNVFPSILESDFHLPPLGRSSGPSAHTNHCVVVHCCVLYQQPHNCFSLEGLTGTRESRLERRQIVFSLQFWCLRTEFAQFVPQSTLTFRIKNCYLTEHEWFRNMQLKKKIKKKKNLQRGSFHLKELPNLHS